MKKNRTTKIAIIVLALVLATSCFVGTTLAKYTTKITGADSARVAKWGVVLEADDTLFEEKYPVSSTDSSISVDARDAADVVAPGTTGTATIFTIAGVPEVDVQVLVSLSGAADTIADDLTMVTLPAGTYTDYTVRVANQAYGTFDVGTDYYPVVWTLTFDPASTVAADPTQVATGNLAAIETYLASISKKYEVNDTDSEFDAICGTYVLTWDWSFDQAGAGTNDKADTFLGQIAAGTVIAPTGYVANEAFNLLITVDQVD